MQLSLHADYALRVLIYLGARPERIVTTQEISNAYGISKHHLVRVIHTLAKHGFVEIHPGRMGGVTLAQPPARIRLGEVVRKAEPNLRLAECFDRKTNTCRIAPVCALKAMLAEALESFLRTLDRYTVGDIIGGSGQKELASILTIAASEKPRLTRTHAPAR